jgi:outer membrane protein
MSNSIRCLRVLLAFGILIFPWMAQGQEASGAGDRLTLRDAIRLALARGPEVFLAQAQIARAREAVREARSSELPQVTTGTGLAYNNGFPLSIEGAAPSIIQLGISQPLFSKKNRSLVVEAEQGSLATEAGKDVVANALIARTIQLYSELHQARLALPMLDRQQEAATKNMRSVETLLQVGKARPLDLTQARLAAAGIEQQRLVARERVRVAETGLCELTGLASGKAVRTEKPEIRSELLSLSAEALFQKVLENHPEIREAEAALRAREAHTEAEKAERYPQLAAVGQYALFSRANNYDDYYNRFVRNNYLIGLSIQIPLFNGFRTDARIAQSRHDVEMQRRKLQQLKSDLKMSLERGASDLRIAAGAAEFARLEIAACEEKLKISATLLEAGRIEPQELEAVRTQLLDKQAAALEADRFLLDRQVALLQAAGILHVMF